MVKKLVIKINDWVTKLTLGKVWNFKLNIKDVCVYLEKLDRNNDGKLTTFELLKAVIKYAKEKYLSEESVK